MAEEMRACRDGELSAVAALASRVFRSDGGDMGTDYPLMFASDNLEGLRIAVDRGVPVAHVGVCIRDAVLLGAPLRVASIGAVCTDREYRGRGLATQLMEDARRYARECGASLMLISGGRGLYHRLGYVTVGRFDRYQWKVDQLASFRLVRIELSRYCESDLRDVVALHQLEPIRFIRSTTDWQKLLKVGLLMNRPSELWLVRRQGRIVAYMGVLPPTENDSPKRRVVRVHEFAGSRAALAAALAAFLADCGGTEAVLVTRACDIEFTALAVEQGWPPEAIPFPGTLGVIDAARLITAVRPILRERADTELGVTVDDDAVMLSAYGEACRVAAPGPLAALLFGGDTDEARAVPPAGGRLGPLLDRLFPLPLLWQGYNYV